MNIANTTTGKEAAHLALLLLQLDLDVGELGPELLVGSLQGGQGIRLVPPGPAGAPLGHGEGRDSPAAPAAPLYIFWGLQGGTALSHSLAAGTQHPQHAQGQQLEGLDSLA